MIDRTDEIERLTESISVRRAHLPKRRAMLVGISGIDASGKGFLTENLAAQLESADYRCGVINVDAWLNLPHVRFGNIDPGKHFYHHALRLDEMFESLVLPLRSARTARVTVERAEETACFFQPYRYEFDDIDIILLEGIFIFKTRYLHHFDLRIWIECEYNVALHRAVARAQEGLLPEKTIEAYRGIYFPAQRIHFGIDSPQTNADLVFANS